jgi:non-heme chloroperoxidase
MPFVTVGRENSGNIDLYYEDHGSGPVVVLSHGWPLSSDAWEKQLPALLSAGYRVILYDRRGFGRSSKPTSGYSYDVFADDFHAIVAKLELHKFSFVGHSMGSGEVAGYIGKYGNDRIHKAVFIGALPPFLLKTEDNPTGVDRSVLEDIASKIMADRLAYLSQFLKLFYNISMLTPNLVSDDVIKANFNVAAQASAVGTLACVPAWPTDFRAAVASITVPSLIIHGDADKILPIESTAIPLSKTLRSSRLVTVEGGPHGIPWTHHEIVNAALLEFLGSATR